MTAFGESQSLPSSTQADIALHAHVATTSSFVPQIPEVKPWQRSQWEFSASLLSGSEFPRRPGADCTYGATASVQLRAELFEGYFEWLASRPAPTKVVTDIRVVIGELFAKGDVVSARRILTALAPEELDSTLRALRSVIAPPTVTRKEQFYGSRAADFEWLKTRSGPYSGRWVALDDGVLISDGSTLRDALSRAAAIRPGITPLVYHVR